MFPDKSKIDSVQELRARIEEISIDRVDLQETREDDKGFDAPKLTAAVDLVARLPYGISSEIFLQCLAPSSDETRRSTPCSSTSTR